MAELRRNTLRLERLAHDVSNPSTRGDRVALSRELAACWLVHMDVDHRTLSALGVPTSPRHRDDVTPWLARLLVQPPEHFRFDTVAARAREAITTHLRQEEALLAQLAWRPSRSPSPGLLPADEDGLDALRAWLADQPVPPPSAG